MGILYLCLIVHLFCVPVLDISMRALSGASLEISRTRHAFYAAEKALPILLWRCGGGFDGSG